jgi:hypothetical protein
MTDLAQCLAILKALRISEVRYHLSGGGDSGTAELEQIFYCDGHNGPLPTVTLGINDFGGLVCLDECLDDIVARIPDGDWINNEGGYGHVALHPQETDDDLQVECEMTYGQENDSSDFEDDEELRRADFKQPDPAAPIAIDDSTLQPPKGENQ